MPDGRTRPPRVSADRLELLRRSRGRQAPRSALARIERRDTTEPAVASHLQRGLWFIDQLLGPGENSAYNVSAGHRLRGRLDVAALRAALTEIVRRQQALRTVFREQDGSVVQLVLPSSVVELPVVPVASGDLRVVAEQEVTRPFDLATGPLWRALLVRLAGDDHALILAFHHAVVDGVSVGVFNAELSALYRAFVAGQPSPLPDLPVQYSDYAHWQRERFRSGAMARQVQFWRERLAGAPPLLRLPTDRPRPAVASYAGAECRVQLPAGLSAGLRRLAQAERATLFMVLLAAYQALLARWAGQSDVCVGTPVAGRVRAELEPLIGYFINTLVMRGDLAGDLSFLDLLRQVRSRTLAAYENQEVPFELLVEELRPGRSLGHNALFQVVLNVTAGGETLDLPGVDCAEYRIDTGDAKFDLVLDVEDQGDGLACVFGYRADLFEAATMQRMAGQWQALLAEVVADPSVAVGLNRVQLAWPDEVLDNEAAEEAVPYVAPRTPTEELVAEVWAELLAADRVGVNDDFFVLGGYSVLATQVVARLGERLAVGVPLTAVFEDPTAAGLAERLDRLVAERSRPAATIERVDRDRYRTSRSDLLSTQ